MSDYCEYINCNCKYCEEGQCDFPAEGSGYPYNAPCFRYEKEDDDGETITITDSDTIARRATKDMINNHRCDFSTEKDYRTAMACVNAIPPMQSVIVPCNYVEACNIATMDKSTSAVWYLEVLEELKKHGYVLVDARGGK